MSSTSLQRLVNAMSSVKQHARLPHISDLPCVLPTPKATVPDSDVPALFREPYVLSGYRPVGQDWLCYVLSVFQRHNESMNVWSHLLAMLVLLLRWWAYVGASESSLAASSLPLCLYVASAITYMTFSITAHLLQSHSELAHYSLFFLDYVGVAVHQYGCALGHYFYTSEVAWRESVAGRFFLPAAAFLAWLSCASCCYAKFHYLRPYPLRRKACQVVPASVAYALGISPVIHRLATVAWETTLPFHLLQVVFFLLSAFFFSFQIPERFFPGHCDFVGQGHHIFHVLLAMCTFSQLEALCQDHTRRRDTVVETFGEGQLWWACVSFPALALFSMLTAFLCRRCKQKVLSGKQLKDK